MNKDKREFGLINAEKPICGGESTQKSLFISVYLR